jgi:sigma-B regulation protein RsbU (phosphoserine phosphatase)
MEHHEIGILLGDVSGHGVPAALFLTLLHSFTERLSPQWGRDPAGFMTELNREIFSEGLPVFITAVYGLFDFSGKTPLFRFSRGGHPPVILYRSGSGSVETYNPPGKPMGILEESDYSEIELSLKKGDRIFLYTDGINETVDIKKQMLDLNGLMDIITKHSGEKLGASLDSILKEVEEFRGDAPVTDDIVIIGFEIK